MGRILNRKGLSEGNYFDDFFKIGSNAKKYRQILFHPGRPPQAREYNQLQTLLTEYGKNNLDLIFKNGSIVQGGYITLNDLDLTVGESVVYFDGALIKNEEMIFPLSTNFKAQFSPLGTLKTKDITVRLVINYDIISNKGEVTTPDPIYNAEQRELLDPAVNYFENEAMIGADRLKLTFDLMLIVNNDDTPPKTYYFSADDTSSLTFDLNNTHFLEFAKIQLNYDGISSYSILDIDYLSNTPEYNFTEATRLTDDEIIEGLVLQASNDIDSNINLNPNYTTEYKEANPTIPNSISYVNIGKGIGKINGIEIPVPKNSFFKFEKSFKDIATNYKTNSEVVYFHNDKKDSMKEGVYFKYFTDANIFSNLGSPQNKLDHQMNFNFEKTGTKIYVEQFDSDTFQHKQIATASVCHIDPAINSVDDVSKEAVWDTYKYKGFWKNNEDCIYIQGMYEVPLATCGIYRDGEKTIKLTEPLAYELFTAGTNGGLGFIGQSKTYNDVTINDDPNYRINDGGHYTTTLVLMSPNFPSNLQFGYSSVIIINDECYDVEHMYPFDPIDNAYTIKIRKIGLISSGVETSVFCEAPINFAKDDVVDVKIITYKAIKSITDSSTIELSYDEFLGNPTYKRYGMSNLPTAIGDAEEFVIFSSIWEDFVSSKTVIKNISTTNEETKLTIQTPFLPISEGKYKPFINGSLNKIENIVGTYLFATGGGIYYSYNPGNFTLTLVNPSLTDVYTESTLIPGTVIRVSQIRTGTTYIYYGLVKSAVFTLGTKTLAIELCSALKYYDGSEIEFLPANEENITVSYVYKDTALNFAHYDTTSGSLFWKIKIADATAITKSGDVVDTDILNKSNYGTSTDLQPFKCAYYKGKYNNVFISDITFLNGTTPAILLDPTKSVRIILEDKFNSGYNYKNVIEKGASLHVTDSVITTATAIYNDFNDLSTPFVENILNDCRINVLKNMSDVPCNNYDPEGNVGWSALSFTDEDKVLGVFQINGEKLFQATDEPMFIKLEDKNDTESIMYCKIENINTKYNLWHQGSLLNQNGYATGSLGMNIYHSDSGYVNKVSFLTKSEGVGVNVDDPFKVMLNNQETLVNMAKGLIYFVNVDLTKDFYNTATKYVKSTAINITVYRDLENPYLLYSNDFPFPVSIENDPIRVIDSEGNVHWLLIKTVLGTSSVLTYETIPTTIPFLAPSTPNALRCYAAPYTSYYTSCPNTSLWLPYDNNYSIDLTGMIKYDDTDPLNLTYDKTSENTSTTLTVLTGKKLLLTTSDKINISLYAEEENTTDGIVIENIEQASAESYHPFMRVRENLTSDYGKLMSYNHIPITYPNSTADFKSVYQPAKVYVNYNYILPDFYHFYLNNSGDIEFVKTIPAQFNDIEKYSISEKLYIGTISISPIESSVPANPKAFLNLETCLFNFNNSILEHFKNKNNTKKTVENQKMLSLRDIYNLERRDLAFSTGKKFVWWEKLPGTIMPGNSLNADPNVGHVLSSYYGDSYNISDAGVLQGFNALKYVPFIKNWNHLSGSGSAKFTDNLNPGDVIGIFKTDDAGKSDLVNSPNSAYDNQPIETYQIQCIKNDTTIILNNPVLSKLASSVDDDSATRYYTIPSNFPINNIGWYEAPAELSEIGTKLELIVDFQPISYYVRREQTINFVQYLLNTTDYSIFNVKSNHTAYTSSYIPLTNNNKTDILNFDETITAGGDTSYFSTAITGSVNFIRDAVDLSLLIFDSMAPLAKGYKLIVGSDNRIVNYTDGQFVYLTEVAPTAWSTEVSTYTYQPIIYSNMKFKKANLNVFDNEITPIIEWTNRDVSFVMNDTTFETNNENSNVYLKPATEFKVIDTHEYYSGSVNLDSDVILNNISYDMESTVSKDDTLNGINGCMLLNIKESTTVPESFNLKWEIGNRWDFFNMKGYSLKSSCNNDYNSSLECKIKPSNVVKQLLKPTVLMTKTSIDTAPIFGEIGFTHSKNTTVLNGISAISMNDTVAHIVVTPSTSIYNHTTSFFNGNTIRSFGDLLDKNMNGIYNVGIIASNIQVDPNGLITGIKLTSGGSLLTAGTLVLSKTSTDIKCMDSFNDSIDEYSYILNQYNKATMFETIELEVSGTIDGDDIIGMNIITFMNKTIKHESWTFIKPTVYNVYNLSESRMLNSIDIHITAPVGGTGILKYAGRVAVNFGFLINNEISRNSIIQTKIMDIDANNTITMPDNIIHIDLDTPIYIPANTNFFIGVMKENANNQGAEFELKYIESGGYDVDSDVLYSYPSSNNSMKLIVNESAYINKSLKIDLTCSEFTPNTSYELISDAITLSEYDFIKFTGVTSILKPKETSIQYFYALSEEDAYSIWHQFDINSEISLTASSSGIKIKVAVLSNSKFVTPIFKNYISCKFRRLVVSMTYAKGGAYNSSVGWATVRNINYSKLKEIEPSFDWVGLNGSYNMKYSPIGINVQNIQSKKNISTDRYGKTEIKTIISLSYEDSVAISTSIGIGGIAPINFNLMLPTLTSKQISTFNTDSSIVKSAPFAKIYRVVIDFINPFYKYKNILDQSDSFYGIPILIIDPATHKHIAPYTKNNNWDEFYNDLTVNTSSFSYGSEWITNIAGSENLQTDFSHGGSNRSFGLGNVYGKKLIIEQIDSDVYRQTYEFVGYINEDYENVHLGIMLPVYNNSTTKKSVYITIKNIMFSCDVLTTNEPDRHFITK